MWIVESGKWKVGNSMTERIEIDWKKAKIELLEAAKASRNIKEVCEKVAPALSVGSDSLRKRLSAELKEEIRSALYRPRPGPGDGHGGTRSRQPFGVTFKPLEVTADLKSGEEQDRKYSLLDLEERKYSSLREAFPDAWFWYRVLKSNNSDYGSLLKFLDEFPGHVFAKLGVKVALLDGITSQYLDMFEGNQLEFAKACKLYFAVKEEEAKQEKEKVAEDKKETEEKKEEHGEGSTPSSATAGSKTEEKPADKQDNGEEAEKAR